MTVSIAIDPIKYAQLLTDVLPRVIESKADYAYFEEKFKMLIRNQDRTPEEDAIFDLLANLLEDYEARTFEALEQSAPLDKLKFLIEQNSLKQTDLTEFFGSQGNASQVLSGKRKISRNAAESLESISSFHQRFF